MTRQQRQMISLSGLSEFPTSAHHQGAVQYIYNTYLPGKLVSTEGSTEGSLIPSPEEVDKT